MQNPPLLQGPSVIPTNSTHALICLHGFGADGHNLLPLAAPLQAACGQLGERLAVFCPDAPQETPMGQGRQWFSDANWTFRDPAGLQALLPQLNAYLQHISHHQHIPPQNIALLGFSQGAMTLLYSLPSLTPAPAALICMAGAMPVPPTQKPSSQTPILFLHGLDDDVLPADTSLAAQAYYQSHGTQTELHLLPNLGHGFNMESLAHIGVFLQAIFTTTALDPTTPTP